MNQVALEGQISRASLEASMTRGHRASGDLIPWSLSQQYQDGQFASLSGARIVRIATHTDVQKVFVFGGGDERRTVSYTHLTLPTICSV